MVYHPLVRLLGATLALLAVQGAQSDPQVEQLVQLRGKYKDGVIRLTESFIREYFVGSSRPFTAAVFFGSEQMIQERPEIKLADLRIEYGLASKASMAGADSEKMFFFEALLEDGQTPFALLQVAALPTIVRIAPSQSMKNPPIDLPKADKMLPDTVDMKKYPWPAEMMLVHLCKDLTAGPVVRPTLYNSPSFPFILAAAVMLLGYVAYLLWMTSFIRHPAIWATVSMAVFWFSASGGMFNIIRGMPLFIRDKNGRLQFFLGNRGAQLGAEGFIMGGLYILCSGCLALITYVLPRIANKAIREAACWVLSVGAIASVYYTFKFWLAKSGYQHVFYF